MEMFVTTKTNSPGCVFLPDDTSFTYLFYMDYTAWELKEAASFVPEPCVSYTKDGWIYLPEGVTLGWESENLKRPIICAETGYWVCAETGNRVTAVKIDWDFMKLKYCFS
jgi:hypothetical protein